MLSKALDALKKYWGYDSFRPLQRDVIESVIDGRDTFALMPTGGGKSITFQVPGMVREGMTLIVTPLVSLMKDQTDALSRRGIKAVCLHSGMTSRELRISREKLDNARCKFLYVSPERLSRDVFCAELKRYNIVQIVIDEAHCISQWGYDFRPSYLNIAKLRRFLPGVPFLALTATATPVVVDDICKNLQLENPRIFRMSFMRDNIQYVVRSAQDKAEMMRHIISRTSGSVIVYVRSRRKAREIAEHLNHAGFSASFYHACLSPEEKSERQDKWMNGGFRIMVATNAFGMGIDKPDVRLVLHYDLPPSLEEYYQEAGRAGRDGKHSFAVLLVARSDKGLARRRVTESFPPRADIKRIYDLVCDYLGVAMGEGYQKVYDFNLLDFCEKMNLQERKVGYALKILSAAGYLDYQSEAETRSRLMIICDRCDLYNVNLSENAEIVLEMLLRTYPGIFADYVYISEPKIESETYLSQRQVYDALLELSRTGCLHYVPARRTPVIGFPTSREEGRYISIGRNVYEERRASLNKRVEAMLDYAYSDVSCRVKRMVAYFGETEACDCGKCDVCLAKKKNRKSEEADSVRITREVYQFVKDRQNGVRLPVIINNIEGSDELIIGSLGYLCDEGYIRYESQFYYPV